MVSAGIVCVFLIHATLGSFQSFFAVPSLASWLVWAGMVLVGVHALLCIATSVEQLTDTVRPPSVQKKRHLALKWATGIGLIAMAGVHIWRIRSLGPVAALHSAEGAVWTISLTALLTAHIWTGSKSLLKDLGIDRKWRNAVRAGACVFAAVFTTFALAHLCAA